MKISKKCKYALQALVELSLKDSDELVSIHELAEAREIPSRFLEAILRQLRQAGLTESERGKNGGYRLARPAREITAGEVIEVFEGRFPGAEAMGDVDLDGMWEAAGETLSTALNQYTLADLSEGARNRLRSGDYVI